MNEPAKTVAFLAAAAVLSAMAVFTEPERRTAAIFSETGQSFFPNYTNPQDVKTIEVIVGGHFCYCLRWWLMRLKPFRC